MNAPPEAGPRPELGEGADDRAFPDLAAGQHDGKFEVDAAREPRVGEIGRAVDPAALADDAAAEQMGVRADDRVPADPDALLDVGRLGILERDARFHPFAVDPVLQDLFHKRKLLSGVDAHDLPRVPGLHGGHGLPAPERRADDVGQIVFVLAVGVREARESGEKKTGGDGVDAGVDLADLFLRLRRVALLDDPPQLPARVAEYAPVAARLGEARGDERQRRVPLAVAREQPRERPPRDRRHVAAQDHHGAGKALEDLPGAADRVARAELPLLDHPLDPVLAAGLPDQLRAVPDDDGDFFRIEAARGFQRMHEQRFAAQGMQDFGQSGVHSLPQPGREQDDA